MCRGRFSQGLWPSWHLVGRGWDPQPSALHTAILHKEELIELESLSNYLNLEPNSVDMFINPALINIGFF